MNLISTPNRAYSTQKLKFGLAVFENGGDTERPWPVQTSWTNNVNLDGIETAYNVCLSPECIWQTKINGAKTSYNKT